MMGHLLHPRRLAHTNANLSRKRPAAGPPECKWQQPALGVPVMVPKGPLPQAPGGTSSAAPSIDDEKDIGRKRVIKRARKAMRSGVPTLSRLCLGHLTPQMLKHAITITPSSVLLPALRRCPPEALLELEAINGSSAATRNPCGPTTAAPSPSQHHTTPSRDVWLQRAKV
eukprot:m.435848 g.435848  ORF g.435848 m.435848 type:complete len:170 (-) comp20262_c0_seq2:662-1171(-)